MLTLAFAQIVWAICFKWNAVTGGEQGLRNVPYPDFDWMDALPAARRAARGRSLSTCWCWCSWASAFRLLRRIVDSPFGRMLTAIRENPERAEFVGLNVRRYQLAAFVIAGVFAGLGRRVVRHVQSRRLPDFAYWSKSAEVLIMAILGGMGTFWGPAIGAAALIAAQPADHVLHAVLAAGARHGADRAAVRVSRRHRRCARRVAGCGQSRRGAMLEVRELRKSVRRLGGHRRREPGGGAPRDRRHHRPERRRQVDAVQPDHRPPAARRRPRRLRGPRHHRRSRRTSSADGRRRARSSAPTSSRKLTVFQNVQAALIAHRGRAREPAGRRRRAPVPRRDRWRCWPRRPRRTRPIAGGTLSHGNQKQLELGIALAGEPRSCCSTSPPPACRATETRDSIALIAPHRRASAA